MPTVILDLDSSGAIKGLQAYNKQVKRAEKSTSSFEKMGRSVLGLGKTLTMLGGIMTTIAGSAAIMLGKNFTLAAADMQEVQGKFDTVFKGMSTEAESWAKVLNDSYSMSMYAGKKYMASLQDILVPTGMARQSAGELSFELTKLAADLSAFGDGSMTQAQAVDNLKSALTGSYEVMKKFGIVLTVNKVAQEAVNLGLADNVRNVSESAKAMASYSLILQGSTDAMGAHQREQDSFNGLMKEAQKLWQDFSIMLGTYILPYATQFLQMLVQWGSDQQNLNKIIVGTVDVVQFLYNGMKGIELSAKFLIAAFAKFFNFMIKGLNIVSTLSKKIVEGLIFLGVKGLQPALDAFQDLTQFAEDFDAASTEALVNTWHETEQANAKFEQFKQNILAGKDAMKGLGDATGAEMDKAKEKIDYAAQAQDRFNKMLAQFKSNMQAAGGQTSDSMGQAKTSIDTAKESVDSAISAQNTWTAAAGQTATAYEAVAKAAAGAAGAVKAVSGSGGGGGGTGITSYTRTNIPQGMSPVAAEKYQKYYREEMLRMVDDVNKISGTKSYAWWGDHEGVVGGPARYAEMAPWTFEQDPRRAGLLQYFETGYAGNLDRTLTQIVINQTVSRSDIDAIIAQAKLAEERQ